LEDTTAIESEHKLASHTRTPIGIKIVSFDAGSIASVLSRGHPAVLPRRDQIVDVHVPRGGHYGEA
jgi:hypothetical protein